MFLAGFWFFDNRDPANPFVAGERGEVVPFFEHGGMGGEDLFEVGRGWVEEFGGHGWGIKIQLSLESF